MKKVLIVYGGRSGEHEISLRSAYSVAKFVDRKAYEVCGVGISKSGNWYFADSNKIDSLLEKNPSELEISENKAEEVNPILVPQGKGRFALLPQSGQPIVVDVVFPVMHGPLCEDGAIQGLFELVDAACVGSGVLGSAVSMDKEFTKRLARDAGIPILPFVSLLRTQEPSSLDVHSPLYQKAKAACEDELGYPVFVKPARMGSSVGVHKVKTENTLLAALRDAFQYDTKVLIEKGIEAKEIELSVLKSAKDQSLKVSVPGEILPKHEFYSYEAKYLDPEGAQFFIPARITDQQKEKAQEIALNTFRSLEIQGLARVDLLQDKKTGELFLNEPNTMPGFTSISQYPKLWEASGLSYPSLLTELIEEALQRNQMGLKIQRSFKN